MTLILDSNIEKKFDEYSSILKLSKEELVRNTLMEKLEEIEDYLEVKADINSGELSFKTLEQVEQSLELENRDK